MSGTTRSTHAPNFFSDQVVSDRALSRERELGTGSATVGWYAKTPGTTTATMRGGLSFQPPNDARYHRRRIFACRLEELVVVR